MPFLAITVLAFVFPVIFPFVIPAVVIGISLWIVESWLIDVIFKDPDQLFRATFKKDVVEWLLLNINESFKYQTNDKIPQQKIEQAQIFKDTIDDYQGEDYVKGVISGVEVEICEGQLFVDKRTVTYIAKELASTIFVATGELLLAILGGEGGGGEGDDGPNRNLVVFFNGMLMQADFNKNHNGSIHVIPVNKARSWFVKKEFFHGKRRVEMDNTSFNESFSTYTTGELEAHYVLSPQLMQTLLEIEENVKGGIYISFSSGKLFLGIDWKRDLFEADLNKPITSAGDVEHIMSQINFFESLVKKLALDRKIWTVEAVNTDA